MGDHWTLKETPHQGTTPSERRVLQHHQSIQSDAVNAISQPLRGVDSWKIMSAHLSSEAVQDPTMLHIEHGCLSSQSVASERGFARQSEGPGW